MKFWRNAEMLAGKCLHIGFRKGFGSNVSILKVHNGEYGGADEPQKLQNFVRPSKYVLE